MERDFQDDLITSLKAVVEDVHVLDIKDEIRMAIGKMAAKRAGHKKPYDLGVNVPNLGYFAIENKQVADGSALKTSFSFSDIKSHQLDHLRSAHRSGACGCVIVNFHLRRPSPKMIRVWGETFGTKARPAEDFFNHVTTHETSCDRAYLIPVQYLMGTNGKDQFALDSNMSLVEFEQMVRDPKDHRVISLTRSSNRWGIVDGLQWLRSRLK